MASQARIHSEKKLKKNTYIVEEDIEKEVEVL